MSAERWVGVVVLVLLASFVIFALRQGAKVKPDKNRRNDDWPNITLGGS
jgi:hypothetical protein